MRPRDLFRGLRGSIEGGAGGPRGPQGAKRASRGSHGAIGLVWWVFSWFIRHIFLADGTDGTGPTEGSTRGPRGLKKQNIRIDNTFDTRNRVGIARNTKIPKIEYEIPSETRVLFSSSVRLSSPLQSWWESFRDFAPPHSFTLDTILIQYI